MREIYITNNNSMTHNVKTMLDLIPTKSNLVFTSEDLKRAVIQIQGQFYISLNGLGRVVMLLNDDEIQTKVCVEYISLNDIKSLNYLIKKDDSPYLIINACEATAQGQYSFDMLLKMISIDSTGDNIKRFCAFHTDAHITSFKNDLIPNKEFHSIFESVLCEKILEQYFTLYSEKLFNKKISISLNELTILSLLDERKSQIDTRSKKDFYFLAYLLINGCKFKVFISGQDKIKTSEELSPILEYLKSIHENKKLVLITSVSKDIIHNSHPLLYNTSDLLKDAKNNKIGTLEEIQTSLNSLYSSGYITNPETTCNHVRFSYMNDVVTILSKLYQSSQFSRYIKYIQEKGNYQVSTRVCNDDFASAAQAIVPTSLVPNQRSLTEVDGELYSMIVKRFLSVFMGESNSVTLTITGLINSEYKLKYERTLDFNNGWKLLYQPIQDLPILLQTYSNEDFITNAFSELKIENNSWENTEDIIIEEASTKSKLNYSVSGLINALQSSGKTIINERKKIQNNRLGIGTDENKGQAITAMKNNNLIEIVDERVILTEKGESIIAGAPPELIKKETLIRFNRLNKDVQLAKLKIKDALYSQINIIQACYNNKDSNNNENIYDNVVNENTCQYCYSSLVNAHSEIKCSRCFFTIPKIMYGYRLETEDINKLIKDGITNEINNFIFKDGRIKNGKGYLRMDYSKRRPGIVFNR